MNYRPVDPKEVALAINPEVALIFQMLAPKILESIPKGLGIKQMAEGLLNTLENVIDVCKEREVVRIQNEIRRRRGY